MKDAVHSPVADGDTYKCIRCDIEIPVEAVLAARGLDVVDIAGLGETFLPMQASTPGACISCTHPSLTKQKSLISDEFVVGLTEEQEKGNKPAHPVSAVEKRVAEQAYANFWGMREAMRPEGYDDVT